MTADLEAPLEVARWRPFVQWLLAFPHWIVLYAMGTVAGIIAFVAWFAILFTGRYPSGLFAFMAMEQRYQWRVYSYALGLHEVYPPFEFESTPEDNSTYPARYAVEEPETLSRLLLFLKWLLIIPHFIVLLFVWIGAYFAWLIGIFAVLFTGKWPQGIRDFLVGTNRWGMRVTAYIYFMRDEYPPFALD